MLTCHVDILDLWPSTKELTADSGAAAESVRKWRQRGRIPSEYWLPIVEAAKRRVAEGGPKAESFARVTLELLARLQTPVAREATEERATA